MSVGYVINGGDVVIYILIVKFESCYVGFLERVRDFIFKLIVSGF